MASVIDSNPFMCPLFESYINAPSITTSPPKSWDSHYVGVFLNLIHPKEPFLPEKYLRNPWRYSKFQAEPSDSQKAMLNYAVNQNYVKMIIRLFVGILWEIRRIY